MQDAEGAATRRLVAALQAERAELRGHLSELASQCAALSAQVQGLSALLQAPGVRSRDLAEWPPGHCATSRKEFRPSIEMVRNQPTHVSQLDNVTLVELSLKNSHAAHKERLLREIMQVDGVSWEEAHKQLEDMDVCNENFYWLGTMPYRIGIIGAVAGSVITTLMVFSKPIVEWYGVNVVGEDRPEGVEDISGLTTNQVGTWSWSWMEPMIGTASFVLLCMQVARAQAWKLNMRPYTETMLRWRANRLAAHYPQYDQSIVRCWAKHLPMVQWNLFPTYRRHLGFKGL